MSAHQTHQETPGATQLPLGKEPHLGTRKRLAERLQRGAAWTVDLRREPERYGCNPADGVYELRNLGWDIRTLRAWTYDREGRPDDYRDFYVLVLGKRIDWTGRGERPVFGSMLAQPWRSALLKAWEREP